MNIFSTVDRAHALRCGATLACWTLVFMMLFQACGGTKPARSTTPPALEGGSKKVIVSAGAVVSDEAQTNWAEALASFSEAERSGWDSRACRRVRGKFDDANKAQSGRFVEAIYMVGTVYSRCGERQEANQAFEQALRLQPKFCKARVALGVDEFLNGSPQRAAEQFKTAVRNDAQCAEAYLDLAIMEQARETTRAESLSNLRRALAIRSNYLPVFNQMALLYLDESRRADNKGSLDLAEIVCRQAQLIDAKYAQIYNSWGLVNMEKGDIIVALRMFEKAITLDTNFFEAYVNFGHVTATFRGYEDSKRAFERAVALRPKDYDAHIGLGMAMRGIKDFAKAKSEYEVAKSLDANKPEAYFNLAVLHQDYFTGSLADYTAAKEYFRTFLAKAGSKEKYAAAVDEVRRTCQTQGEGGKKRRRRRADCRSGRLQNLDTSIDALRAAEAMQRKKS